MFAIVEIAGKQFRVENEMTVKVPFLNKEVGDAVEFDRILLVGDGEDVKIGRPTVDGAKVNAKVVNNGRDGKVVVFKKKRRKGYRLTRGHRQDFTRVQIEAIALS
ncbi:MAG TPA: 50S ribosomal protein L21 [Calditrichia bacterium]|nr:50S ribosomal protein L21 [Calditrichota bacterium]HQU72627.1 50S ribosomal protein L21 [Calditrichia bacterium]HQV30668.1 50S ribosomal protein L21 [Calditrichia bacterium]